MRFFHPSCGNTCVLPQSTLICDSADLHRFLKGVFDQDFYELVERSELVEIPSGVLLTLPMV